MVGGRGVQGWRIGVNIRGVELQGQDLQGILEG